MKCSNCGSGVEGGWKFCPKCGARTGRRIFSFGDIFSKALKDMETLSKRVDRDMEAFDISPWFDEIPEGLKNHAKPSRKGFSIRITSGTGMEPNIDVKTFGNVDKEEVRKQIEKMSYVPSKPSREKEQPRKERPAPKNTEEPATTIRKEDSMVLVDMDIPGVKEEDIEIEDLESSIEVKAISGDKAYFKIITKPEAKALVESRFADGKLHLEFA